MSGLLAAAFQVVAWPVVRLVAAWDAADTRIASALNPGFDDDGP